MVFSTNYIELDGAYYALDMDALSAFIVGSDNEKVIDRTKTEQWVGSENPKDTEMALMTKEITETSSSRKDEHAPFRAEVAKMMLSLIMYPTVGENGESKELKTLESENMSVGQIIAFNTFIAEGIIKEIQIEENGEEE